MKSNTVLIRASILWVLLVGLTLLSIEFPATLADGHGLDIQLGVIVALTFFKVFIIGWKFMELDRAPTLFRGCFLLWIVGVGGSILLFAVS